MSKGQTVECMVVRHFEEDNVPKVEVWVGSGQSDDTSAQVAIIDLCDKGVEVKSIVNGYRPHGMHKEHFVNKLIIVVFCFPKRLLNWSFRLSPLISIARLLQR